MLGRLARALRFGRGKIGDDDGRKEADGQEEILDEGPRSREAAIAGRKEVQIMTGAERQEARARKKIEKRRAARARKRRAVNKEESQKILRTEKRRTGEQEQALSASLEEFEEEKARLEQEEQEIAEIERKHRSVVTKLRNRRNVYYGQTRKEEHSVKYLRHGYGVRKKATPPYGSGDRYEGTWELGQMQGHGVLQFLNGDRYRGQFLWGAIHGYGRYEYNSKEHPEWRGDVFQGFFDGGKKHTLGVYYFAESRGMYTGEFWHGHFHGWAKLESDVEIYEGQFDTDLKSGLGVQYWGPGYDELEQSYSGDFGAGKRDGSGVLQFTDGSRFAGEFKDGQMCGAGKLSISQDDYFQEGFWERGRRHGNCVVGQSHVTSAKWRTEHYEMGQLVSTRPYNYRLDFLPINSRAQAAAVHAENRAHAARQALANEMKQMMSRARWVQELTAEAATKAATDSREARIWALQSPGYRSLMGIGKDDTVQIKRKGKRILVMAEDYIKDEDETKAGRFMELVTQMQAGVAELHERVVTSFAQHKPEDRTFETQKGQNEEFDGGRDKKLRVEKKAWEGLIEQLKDKEFERYSKLGMMRLVVKSAFLSLRELTELVSHCRTTPEKVSVVQEYWPRLLDNEYPEELLALLEGDEAAIQQCQEYLDRAQRARDDLVAYEAKLAEQGLKRDTGPGEKESAEINRPRWEEAANMRDKSDSD
mmetsp:Transcript_39769/g.93367  ORF Transcript_39769/g.93367 Transcript_39769/m.93367 type:complete len:705 (+) Transcript_39769:538-2652(+)